MTKDAKKLRCSDCGEAPANGRLNRRGRCGDCAMDAMTLAMQVNLICADLTKKQRAELRKTLAKFAPKRRPVQWSAQVEGAAELYRQGVANRRAVPGRHRKSAS